MRVKFIKIILIAILVSLPVILVFKNLFLNGNLSSGDAPYFYPDNINELIREPFVWSHKSNVLGGINNFLPLYPLMLLIGIISKLLSLNSDSILGLFFYIPAIIGSFIGPYLLARYLKISNIYIFIPSLLYTLNTYFILLIDGGQIGVALAYGMFPIALLALIKIIETPNLNTFIFSFLACLLITIFDVRISIILFITTVSYQLIKSVINKSDLRWILKICLIGASVLLVNLYWILPMLKLNSQSLSLGVSSLKLTSLINGLTLFQPHWPLNQYGKINYPPFYFVIFTLLTFLPLFLSKRKKEVIVFVSILLLFIFLLKGETSPLGNLYQWVIYNLPFGSFFRDSTKFYAPILLISGMLITFTNINNNLKRVIAVTAYIGIIFTVRDAILGNLNYTLSNRNKDNITYSQINLSKNNNNFQRDVWIPYAHPQSFSSYSNPTIDGRELVNLKPIANLNVGTDPFNFLNNNRYLEWLRLFGIKYIVAGGDIRNIYKTEEENKNWDEIVRLLNNNQAIRKHESLPFYEIPSPLPHFYTVQKLYILVGPDTLLSLFPREDKNTKIENQGFLFLEDGKTKPEHFADYINPASLKFVFYKKDIKDFQMFFHQDNLYFPIKNASSTWAIFNNDEYLKFKYELLINNIDTTDSNYDKSIALSTREGESLVLKSHLKESGNYRLAIRYIDASGSADLAASVDNKSFNLPKSRKDVYSWYISDSLQLNEGKKEIIIQNNGGAHAVNLVGIISEEDFKKSKETAEKMINKFGVIYTNDEFEPLKNELRSQNWSNVKIETINPTRYKISAPEYNWVIFTDSYNSGWKLKRGIDFFPSIPVYSSVNGFYIEKNWKDTEIQFKGQRYVRWGIYFSLISSLLLIVSILILYGHKFEKNN